MCECSGESEATVLEDSEQLEVIAQVWRKSNQHVLFCVHDAGHLGIVIENGRSFKWAVAATWYFGLKAEQSNGHGWSHLLLS